MCIFLIDTRFYGPERNAILKSLSKLTFDNKILTGFPNVLQQKEFSQT